jgi:hypothetical protein
VAAVTYSYRVETGSGSEDYYDQFARGFRQEEDAEAWVKSLAGQPIPVHVRPGRPDESMVLSADLEKRFGCGRNH